MDAISFLSFNDVWRGLGPEVILTVSAFLIMVVEFLLPEGKKAVAPWLSLVATVATGAVVITRLGAPFAQFSIAVNAVDDFSSIFKLVLLLSVALVILMAIATKKQQSLPYEYSYLLLFATVGAMIMTSALDLVTLYVGLELLSIASYVLVALYRKSSRSAEGGLKYLIIGSIASASILYGLSFLYGVTGSTSFAVIGQGLQQGWTNFPTLLYVSLALVIAGVGVKISAVPFHLWTADVYEGAPTAVTAFLAVTSKAAAFGLVLRLFIWVYGQKYGQWDDLFAWLAVLSMIVGNLGALGQKNIKRMLAYSSIAHAGYLLVPFASAGVIASDSSISQGLSAIVFYLFAYAFMTIGAFAVFSVVASARASEDIDAFAGLSRRSPWLAGAMTVFLLSMAGIPLTAGFVGKFFIFVTAFNAGQYWLGVILFATSAIAFYYYFGVMRAMFSQKPEGDTERVPASKTMHVVLTLCALGTLVLGIFPSTLMNVLGGLHWFG